MLQLFTQPYTAAYQPELLELFPGDTAAHDHLGALLLDAGNKALPTRELGGLLRSSALAAAHVSRPIPVRPRAGWPHDCSGAHVAACRGTVRMLPTIRGTLKPSAMPKTAAEITASTWSQVALRCPLAAIGEAVPSLRTFHFLANFFL